MVEDFQLFMVIFLGYLYQKVKPFLRIKGLDQLALRGYRPAHTFISKSGSMATPLTRSDIYRFGFPVRMPEAFLLARNLL